ncbi:MAG: hypothetical protein J1G38_00260 [Clostridiales bacterium]|nr:hypothetical protein [Clostridiales bacterium]
MEITSPNSLWKDYDVTALPLNPSELSEKTEDGIKVRELYFDGFINVDGRARAFVRIHENPNAKGVILYIPDISSPTDTVRQEFYEHGYTVMTLDYAGKTDERARFTLYPRSLNGCNYDKDKIREAPEDALTSCWFVWTCIARRAVLLAREMYPELKAFAIGRGLGGSIAYKLCAFNDGLTACTTLLNIIPDVTGQGNRIINYRAALDNSAYASILKTPIFIAVCSNAEDGSLDKMAELAHTTASLKCFRILERAFSDSIKVSFDQVDRFFTEYLNGTIKPSAITVKPTNSENKLYFNINIGGENDEEKREVELFAAFCITNPTFRNWTSIKTVRLGGTEYYARVDVFQNEQPVYAFVNITDGAGNVTTSPLLTVIPKSLSIPAQTAVPRRLIYDGSMGKDVWLSPRGGKARVETGPFGINGVVCDENTMVTFKPGDFLYHASRDALLQIIVNGKCTTMTVTVSDGKERYMSTVKISNSEEWHKFTLSHNDFKSKIGPLADWSKIILFKLEADDTFIISSVLWV